MSCGGTCASVRLLSQRTHEPQIGMVALIPSLNLIQNLIVNSIQNLTLILILTPPLIPTLALGRHPCPPLSSSNHRHRHFRPERHQVDLLVCTALAVDLAPVLTPVLALTLVLTPVLALVLVLAKTNRPLHPYCCFATNCNLPNLHSRSPIPLTPPLPLALSLTQIPSLTRFLTLSVSLPLALLPERSQEGEKRDGEWEEWSRGYSNHPSYPPLSLTLTLSLLLSLSAWTSEGVCGVLQLLRAY